jgi:Ca-activated chloride channel family protein
MKHVLLAVASLVLLAAAVPAAAVENDPLLWPEEQRAFWQDGSALLLTREQRAAFPALDEAGRSAFIHDFLTEELRAGIERRQKLAARDFDSPLDVRSQLLFLQGAPASREVVACAIFKPMELWTYGTPPEKAYQVVLYQPLVSEPFRLWRPIDSKRALYTPDALRWVEDFDAMQMGGKRVDRFFCPESRKVDEATGIVGLRGFVERTGRRGEAAPARGRDAIPQPKDLSNLLAPPSDLAAWARTAAATRLPTDDKTLEAGGLDFDFPSRDGQRLVARGLVAVDSRDPGLTVVQVDGKPRIRLRIEGVIELGSQIFERFRVRYRVPAPEASAPGQAAPIPLVFEKALRPGQRYLLRLRVVDEGSNAQTRMTRSIEVPRDPVSRLGAQVASAASGETLPPGVGGRDALLLLPPIGEVMVNTWRAEALVTGDRIRKVVFLLDGEPQLARTTPPFSAEVRLDPFPREQVVRAEGYDADGALVAADQVVLNQARGIFRVTIEEPRRGTQLSGKVAGKVTARAEVVVPEEQKIESVELKVNDTVVARLTQPPWQAQIEVPPGTETAWLTATARLEDGSQTEDVRFLRSPENLEEMDVDLVELYVSVTDSSGRFLKDLESKDFKVLEDGKPQTLTRFEVVESFPITLGFLIDSSASMADSLGESQRAAEQLLAHLMTPRDRAFAVGFSQFPYVVITPTDDSEGVAQALEGIKAMGRTALYDALITGLFYFRNTQGQRAMILLTDGDDTASTSSWEQALEYTRRSGVVVYPIGLGVGVLSVSARSKLEALAEATGGRVFFIQRADELGGVYSQIEEELRSRYYLTFNSNRKADVTGFRPVEVQVRKGKARTVRGYYP